MYRFGTPIAFIFLIAACQSSHDDIHHDSFAITCEDDVGCEEPVCENTCEEEICENANPPDWDGDGDGEDDDGDGAVDEDFDADDDGEDDDGDGAVDEDNGEPVPTSGGCWVTGIGFVNDDGSKDNFGGNGMPMKAGDIRGQWEHVDHETGNKFHGEVRYLVCRHVDEPGPGQPSGPDKDFDINQAYWGGPGRWFTPDGGWQDGYWFDIVGEDHGEPGKTDEYYFSVRQMANNGVPGDAIYTVGGVLGGGNFQIHPPNNGHPYTSAELPTWVDLHEN